MNGQQLYNFIKERILLAFETKHAFCASARRYKYVEQTFEDDCLTCVEDIPDEISVEEWFRSNVVTIGDKSKGSYLALSALYCRMASEGQDSARDLGKLVSAFDELRECSDSSGSDEPSPMLLAMNDIYNKSIKSAVAESVASLQATPPPGVHYSTKLVQENNASATKLLEGMKAFEELVGSCDIPKADAS